MIGLSEKRLFALELAAGDLAEAIDYQDARIALLAQFIDADPSREAIIEQAATEVGSGEILDLLAGLGAGCSRLRLVFGDWLGKQRLAWPGCVPMRIRLAPWHGRLVVGDGGRFAQVIAEHQIGAV
jgi:hypothetical protein